MHHIPFKTSITAHHLPYKALSLNKCRLVDDMAIVGYYAYMVVKKLPNQRVLVEDLPMHVGNQYN